jgi:hypothetical protein
MATAELRRVATYYVLCLKLGGSMNGDPTLPALLKREKVNCCVALQHAHDSFTQSGTPDLAPLHQIFVDLSNEQIASIANLAPQAEEA